VIFTNICTKNPITYKVVSNKICFDQIFNEKNYKLLMYHLTNNTINYTHFYSYLLHKTHIFAHNSLEFDLVEQKKLLRIKSISFLPIDFCENSIQANAVNT
jgi:hypothetical protein